MGFPNSLSSYPDVQGLFDKAIESPKGLKLVFDTEKSAIFNAGRFNAYRVRLKRENTRVYPADHPLHGATAYDGLMIKRRENVIIIEKLSPERYNVEELP